MPARSGPGAFFVADFGVGGPPPPCYTNWRTRRECSGAIAEEALAHAPPGTRYSATAPDPDHKPHSSYQNVVVLKPKDIHSIDK